MERSLLSSIIDTEVRIDYSGDGKTLELRTNDVLIATVDIDDLFDHEGNRFHDDVD